jgi:hypothetical protein
MLLVVRVLLAAASRVASAIEQGTPQLTTLSAMTSFGWGAVGWRHQEGFEGVERDYDLAGRAVENGGETALNGTRIN